MYFASLCASAILLALSFYELFGHILCCYAQLSKSFLMANHFFSVDMTQKLRAFAVAQCALTADFYQAKLSSGKLPRGGSRP